MHLTLVAAAVVSRAIRITARVPVHTNAINKPLIYRSSADGATEAAMGQTNCLVRHGSRLVSHGWLFKVVLRRRCLGSHPVRVLGRLELQAKDRERKDESQTHREKRKRSKIEEKEARKKKRRERDRRKSTQLGRTGRVDQGCLLGREDIMGVNGVKFNVPVIGVTWNRTACFQPPENMQEQCQDWED